MTDAPERIWAKTYYGKEIAGYWENGPILPNKPENVGVEYIRADLPPTLAQALAVPEVRALVDGARAMRDHLMRWADGGPNATAQESEALYLGLDRPLRAIEDARDV